MRDYDNLPILKWSDRYAPKKAEAQILRQEPVILEMPESFDVSIEGDDFSCKRHEDTAMLYDCDGGKVLRKLAMQNQVASLNDIAEACTRSGSRVDIDSAGRRLVVHD